MVLQGVRNIGKTDLRPTCIFLRSPSLDRLEQRNTDTEQSLAAARADLKPGEQQGARLFDLIMGNDSLDKAYWALKEALSDEMEKAQGTGPS